MTNHGLVSTGVAFPGGPLPPGAMPRSTEHRIIWRVVALREIARVDARAR